MSRPNLTIVHISDTHMKPFADEIQDCDICIHSGDATFRGTRSEILQTFWELKEIAENSAKHVIFVPGNHDIGFEALPKKEIQRIREKAELPDNVHILIFDELEIEDYKFFGNSYQPEFFNWAFNIPRKSEKMVEKMSQIPRDAEVLICHGPPHGILDVEEFKGTHVGCEIMGAMLKEFTKLKLNCFGHIHGGYGQARIGEVIYSNGAFVPVDHWANCNPPHVYELTDERAEFYVEDEIEEEKKDE